MDEDVTKAFERFDASCQYWYGVANREEEYLAAGVHLQTVIAIAIQAAKAEERKRLIDAAEAYARQLPTRGLHGEYARFHIRQLALQISGEAT